MSERPSNLGDSGAGPEDKSAWLVFCDVLADSDNRGHYYPLNEQAIRNRCEK